MRLHLIDGTFELFRAHYSKRPDHRAPGGWDAKATVGVVQSILALLREREEACTHLAVAFDNPIVSFRNDLFADYKSDEGMDPVLRGQFDAVEAAVRSIGVVVWSMNQWEADDALATAAARWRSDVEQVRILTPDKDLGQCLVGNQVVQVDRIRRKVVDEASFRASRGFAPRSMPDFLALVGDTADGIPGLDGFGEKSAGALLARFPSLEEIPEDAKDWPPGMRSAERLAATLRGSRTDAVLYRKLATLVEDVPLKETLGQLEWRGVPRKAFDAWCIEMGLAPEKLAPHRYAEEP